MPKKLTINLTDDDYRRLQHIQRAFPMVTTHRLAATIFREAVAMVQDTSNYTLAPDRDGVTRIFGLPYVPCSTCTKGSEK